MRSESSSLRVVVLDTVDVVLHVHGERHSIQTLFTHHAAETARMVGLSESLEDLDSERREAEGGRGEEPQSMRLISVFTGKLCINIGWK